MQTHRCGHFSIETETIPVLHTAVVLRVPIRRCALAERMVAVISQTEEGHEVTRKLTISMTRPETSGADADQTAESKIRVAFGPDLEAIHAAECTVERCQTSCTPGYRHLLEQFGHRDDAERETGHGCLEISESGADTVAQS